MGDMIQSITKAEFMEVATRNFMSIAAALAMWDKLKAMTDDSRLPAGQRELFQKDTP